MKYSKPVLSRVSGTLNAYSLMTVITTRLETARKENNPRQHSFLAFLSAFRVLTATYDKAYDYWAEKLQNLTNNFAVSPEFSVFAYRVVSQATLQELWFELYTG